MLRVVILEWGKNCNSGLGQKLEKYHSGVVQKWLFGAGAAGGDLGTVPAAQKAFPGWVRRISFEWGSQLILKRYFNLTFLSGRKTRSCLGVFCWLYFVLFYFVGFILFVFMAFCWSFLVFRHWELFCWAPILCRTQVPGLLCDFCVCEEMIYFQTALSYLQIFLLSFSGHSSWW